jgi:hypothetical protein
VLVAPEAPSSATTSCCTPAPDREPADDARADPRARRTAPSARDHVGGDERAGKQAERDQDDDIECAHSVWRPLIGLATTIVILRITRDSRRTVRRGNHS